MLSFKEVNYVIFYDYYNNASEFYLFRYSCNVATRRRRVANTVNLVSPLYQTFIVLKSNSQIIKSSQLYPYPSILNNVVINLIWRR